MFTFWVAILIFVTVFLENGTGKSILAESMIVRAADECCPESQKSCCVDRMKQGKDINCDIKDLMSTVRCLEKALYADSPNNVFAHNCCRLLFYYSCKEKCVYNMWTPTKSPDKKLDFIDSCRPGKEGSNCFIDGFIHMHDCFNHCIEQTHKNGRNFVFNPTDHCPGFTDIDKRELCVLDPTSST